jgi:hypothetical protein
MKTIGRILLIMAVFSILSGLMVVAVNANGQQSIASSDFYGAPSQFRTEGDGDEDGDGIRPGGGEVRGERGGRGGAGGSRWIFGLLKNVGVMALVVTVIALPRSLGKKKRIQVAVNSVNGEV